MIAYLAMIVDDKCEIKELERVPPNHTLAACTDRESAVRNLLQRQQLKLRNLLNETAAVQREHRIALRLLRKMENEELACSAAG